MTAKYFVWGSGAWRELDLSSGCVSGWRRRARFVFVRRGRLHVTKRRAVLQALSALAAGRPSAAADGPRLSQLRTSPVSGGVHRQRERPGPAAPRCHQHNCCGSHHNGKDTTGAPPAVRREAGTQCARDAATDRSLTINIPRASPAPARLAPARLAPARLAPARLAPARPAPDPARTTSSSDEFVSPHAKRRLASSARDRLSEVTALLANQAAAARPRPATESSDDERPLAGRGGAVKELVISDSDVEALRGFVARVRPSALARFDADGAYKSALFYAINPLVELRRCARLERLLRERRDTALPHFAARLGLTPRTAPPSAPPPAPRPRRPPSASSDADKENKEQVSTPKKARVERSAKSGAGSAKPVARPGRAPPPRALPVPTGGGDGAVRMTRSSTGAKVEVDTHGDVTTKRNVHRDVTVRRLNGDAREGRGAGDAATPTDSDIEWAAGAPPPRPAHVLSKRATGGSGPRMEYSNLEDHAIVAWVSVGARASLVNGNAVWRDLQDQFAHLAGRRRTWHSLRNRYLRYILPALGALRLPPAQESRLRAAAATGITKSRKEKRRNSLFKEAERGAASHRPRPPPSPPAPAPDTTRAATETTRDAPVTSRAAHATVATVKADAQTESRVLRRSPRYSEVTRQFAARHAPSTDSSPSPSPAGAAPSPRGGRSRRLFNPNQNV